MPSALTENPCYIASRRVIREGGYEVDGSMPTFDKPTRLALESEDLIVNTVHDLLPDRKRTARESSADPSEKRPNILWITCEDMSPNLGCYGDTYAVTPNLDRLAASGMRFTEAYAACPVCSPTRASIMTGKYPARTGITTYLISPDRDAPHVTSHLPLAEFTIAEAFKKNGYATAYVGKWHIGFKEGDELELARVLADLFDGAGAAATGAAGAWVTGTPSMLLRSSAVELRPSR